MIPETMASWVRTPGSENRYWVTRWMGQERLTDASADLCGSYLCEIYWANAQTEA